MSRLSEKRTAEDVDAVDESSSVSKEDILDLEVRESIVDQLDDLKKENGSERIIIQDIEQHSHDIMVSPYAKRLRPQIGIDMYRGLAEVERDLDEIVEAYLPVEVIQGWSVQIDDVEDGDDKRRKKKALQAHIRENHVDSEDIANWLAINHNLDLRGREYRIITRSDWLEDSQKIDILEILWDAEENLAVGQNLDLLGSLLAENPELKEKLVYEGGEFDFMEFFDEVNYRKTAAPFEAAARITEVVAEDYDGDDLANYTVALAKGFQIRDDVLDITEEEEDLGKDRLSDVHDGNYTVPIYLAEEFLANYPENRSNYDEMQEKAEYLSRVLAKENPTDEELEITGEIIMEYTPAIKSSRRICRGLVEEAKEYIDNIDWADESYAQRLKDMAQFAGMDRGN